MINFLFYTILFFAFFGNSFIDYNIIPKKVEILTEGSIYLLFIFSLISAGKNRNKYHFHLILIYILFIIAACLSAYINDNLGYQAILSIRLVVRYYILYLALINFRFNENQIYKLNNILFFLFVLQLPVQAVKFYFFGFREDTIGTYGTYGGGLTTIIPLVALGYLIAFYNLYKKRFIYLILSGWFIAYGIIGLKLALLFLYPVAFISLYYLNVLKIKGLRIPGDIYKLAVIVLLMVPIGATIISKQVRTNRERQIGGSIDLSYALKSSLKYTTRNRGTNPEFALGRVACSKLAIESILDEKFFTICLGYGPGIINEIARSKGDKNYDRDLERIVGSYGKTGSIFILVEYGFFGLFLIIIIYSIFIKNCWKQFNKEKDPYWKAFTSGCLFFSCVTMFIFLAYNNLTVMGDTIVPVFFYCMAIVYNRKMKSEQELST